MSLLAAKNNHYHQIAWSKRNYIVKITDQESTNLDLTTHLPPLSRPTYDSKPDVHNRSTLLWIQSLRKAFRYVHFPIDSNRLWLFNPKWWSHGELRIKITSSVSDIVKKIIKKWRPSFWRFNYRCLQHPQPVCTVSHMKVNRADFFTGSAIALLVSCYARNVSAKILGLARSIFITSQRHFGRERSKDDPLSSLAWKSTPAEIIYSREEGLTGNGVNSSRSRARAWPRTSPPT